MNLLDQLQQLSPAPAAPSGEAQSGSAQPGTSQPDGAVCSRKACKLPATWQLLWNNPKIHTPDRRKVWVACADHRDWLQDYLQTRGLWKETLPLTPAGGTA